MRALVAVVMLLLLWIVQCRADDQAVHRLRVSGSVKNNNFGAGVDGQTFTTPAALEDYLARLPAGTVIRWNVRIANGVDLNDDEWWQFGYKSKLKGFCQEHHLDFH